MALSSNGWPVLATRPPLLEVPGVKSKFAVRPGDVATVFAELIGRFHREVEDLNLYTEGDEWGWAVRNVRGSLTQISNHASGTAVDLNATRHPRTVKGTFTADQKRKMHTILAAFHDTELGRPILRWGEDYTGTVDGMHVEINAGIAAVHRVAMRIQTKHARPPVIAQPIVKESTVATPAEIARTVLTADLIPNRNAPKDSRNPTWSLAAMVSNMEHTQDQHTDKLDALARIIIDMAAKLDRQEVLLKQLLAQRK